MRLLKRLLRFAFGVITVVASVAVALAIGEGLLRVFDLPSEVRIPAGCVSVNAEWSDAYVFSISHGAYPPSIRKGSCAEEYRIYYETDALGYLGVKGSPVRENRWLVFGDSFAFGLGVEQTETFAALMGAYNAGLWGTTFPTHAYAFPHAADTIKPARAVWVLYPPHLISASAPPGRTTGWVAGGYFDPAKQPRLASLADAHNTTRLSTLVLMATGWGVNRPDYYTREWALYDPADQSVAAGFEAFEKAVADITAAARLRGVKITPVFVPSKVQLRLGLDGQRPPLIRIGHTLDAELPIRRMGGILSKYGIPREDQVDLMNAVFRNPSTPWTDLYLIKDAHWNAKGHRAVAEFLRRTLE